MIYTPLDQAELDVVFDIVADGYAFVTGNDVAAPE